MYLAITAAILVVMILALARAMLGPTIYDRILAINTFGTKTVLLISVMGMVAGRFDFIDIALVYALINFISIVAVLRFFEYSDQAKGEQES
ncbi:MAG: pH regulation protein F [Gammaproteobacteria bacterium]|nr:pH regulation protein F [Gammaproteobacteria bacterium]MAY03374.1 pH regulation protein F [Gammaproteobacteria bacterium]|tara:strand:- start:119 stop:391 length:273 start_codon:yes stop_codon:yes gene_type:complete